MHWLKRSACCVTIKCGEVEIRAKGGIHSLKKTSSEWHMLVKELSGLYGSERTKPVVSHVTKLKLFTGQLAWYINFKDSLGVR